MKVIGFQKLNINTKYYVIINNKKVFILITKFKEKSQLLLRHRKIEKNLVY